MAILQTYLPAQMSDAEVEAAVAAAVAAVSPFVKQIGVRCCARSPTSELIATASDDPNDGNVIIWSTGNNTATGLGAIITTLRGHSAGVLCLTFSHDGSLLFTGSMSSLVTSCSLTILATMFGEVDSISRFLPDAWGSLFSSKDS